MRYPGGRPDRERFQARPRSPLFQDAQHETPVQRHMNQQHEQKTGRTDVRGVEVPLPAETVQGETEIKRPVTTQAPAATAIAVSSTNRPFAFVPALLKRRATPAIHRRFSARWIKSPRRGPRRSHSVQEDAGDGHVHQQQEEDRHQHVHYGFCFVFLRPYKSPRLWFNTAPDSAP